MAFVPKLPSVVIKPEPRDDDAMVIKFENDGDDSDRTEDAGYDDDDGQYSDGTEDAGYDDGNYSDSTKRPNHGHDYYRAHNPERVRHEEIKPEPDFLLPATPWAPRPHAPTQGAKGRPRGAPAKRKEPSTPWSDVLPVRIPARSRKNLHDKSEIPKWPADSEKPARKAERKPKTSQSGPKAKKASQARDSNFRFCARNYAAVDARRETYGLIDQGLVDGGTRTMVMHVRRGQPAWDILNAVRPGSILAAKSKSGRGSPTPLRVRFTTPTKYYPPGCKFSTMTVGIDEVDWQSLMAKARHI